MIKTKDIIDEFDKRIRTISKEVTFPLDDKTKKIIKVFVVVYEYEEGKFENYIIINPKILSESQEEIYVSEGEGCLSVNRNVEGIVPRKARITVEYYDINGKKQKIRLREELSIVFQHEIDHLNGILFIDRIDKNNPYKNIENMRGI